MNALQKQYLLAKAELDIAKTEIEAHMEQYEHLIYSDNEDDWDKYAELPETKMLEANEIALYQVFAKAEKELLEWSRKQVQMVAFMSEIGAINIAYEAAEKNIVVRRKIVQAAMRLQ
jgi:hypothetical protein